MPKSKAMSNTMTKSNSMSNNSRVSNSMGNRMSNRMSNSMSICSNTIISDISNITIIIIGMIVNMLGTAIRKVDRVGTFYNTSTIIGLSLVEGSTRVVISNSIGVRVGRRLSKVRLGISSNSMVSNNWGMVDNWGMGNSNWVSNSMSNSMSESMSNRMRHTVSNSMSKSMSNGVSNTMSNWTSNDTSSSMKTVRRVSYSSNSSSKSFCPC